MKHIFHTFIADFENFAWKYKIYRCADMQNVIQVLRGAERGEPAAMFLSPSSPSFKNSSGVDTARHGSQFTFFLTAPLLAFCQLIDYNLTEDDMVSELLISNSLQK